MSNLSQPDNNSPVTKPRNRAMVAAHSQTRPRGKLIHDGSHSTYNVPNRVTRQRRFTRTRDYGCGRSRGRR